MRPTSINSTDPWILLVRGFFTANETLNQQQQLNQLTPTSTCTWRQDLIQNLKKPIRIYYHRLTIKRVRGNDYVSISLNFKRQTQFKLIVRSTFVAK